MQNPVEARMAAIPQPARWRLASLPEYLSQEELAKLMSAFEQPDPQRQRDHANRFPPGGARSPLL
jgi:integrase/recombinase XerD